jgi:hypothetical protein
MYEALSKLLRFVGEKSFLNCEGVALFGNALLDDVMVLPERGGDSMLGSISDAPCAPFEVVGDEAGDVGG